MSQNVQYVRTPRVGVGIMTGLPPSAGTNTVVIPSSVDRTVLILEAGPRGTAVNRIRVTRVCDSAGSLQTLRFYIGVDILLSHYRDFAFDVSNPATTTYGTQARPYCEFVTPGLFLEAGQQLRFTRNTDWSFSGSDVYTAIALGSDL